MRKWVKWIGVVFLIPILLVLFFSILLYIPTVQHFVVQKATKYVSEATGMQIGVDRIRLAFPLDLTVEGVEVLAAPMDTLLTLQEIAVRINPLPLARKMVSVESFRLQNAAINTGDFMEGIAVKGTICDLAATADLIDLSNQRATLNRLHISGTDLSLHMDSIAESSDTTSTPMLWQIRLGDIALNDLLFRLDMPSDTLCLSAYFHQGNIRNGLVDLGEETYAVNQFNLSDAVIQYDANNLQAGKGFDPSHIVIDHLNTKIDDIRYSGKEIAANIRSFSLDERSGLTISSLEGLVQSDSLTIDIPEMTLKTPFSSLSLSANIPWSILNEEPEGDIRINFSSALSKTDIFTLIPDFPSDFKKVFPNQPITLSTDISGSLASLAIREFHAQIPGALQISGSGKVGNVLDSIRRSATVQLDAQTQNMDFLLSYLPKEQRERFQIPSGITLEGEVGLRNREYTTNLRVTEGDGNMQLDARYHSLQNSYAANLTIDSLEPIHFLPTDSILWVSASLAAEGMGTDLFSEQSWATIQAHVDSIQYLETSVSDIRLAGSLKENNFSAEVTSGDPNIQMNLTLNGTLEKEHVSGMIIMDTERIDLYGLHLMDSTFYTGFQLFAELDSDLKERNKLDVSLGNWEIRTAETRFRPKILTLKAQSDEDTTQVSLHSGDLSIVLTGNAGLNTMMSQFETITEDIHRQMETDSTIHIATLNPLLPDMNLSIKANRDNPIYTLLRPYYISFTSIDIQASTSPERGIRLDGDIYSFAKDTFLVDTIRATIRPDSAGLRYSADVIKNRYRQQQPFKAHLHGSIQNNYVDAELLFTNHLEETGLSLGLMATKENDGYLFRLYPNDPIIAFNSFTLNPDNYLRFTDMKNIEANIRLTGEDNTSIWLHSTDNGDDYQPLHVELNQLNLETVSSGLTMLPDLKGILSANIQYTPTDETFMVVADANIDELFYENGRVGEILFNAVYLPLENSEHQVDLHFYHDREEVAVATALYRAAQKNNNIEGSFDIISLPLKMANAFIPDEMAKLSGALKGNMAISGSASQPLLNGFMQVDTSSIYIGMANTSFRLDNKKIDVKNSLISFNRFNILTTGNNPFVIDGNIDISHFSQMKADLKMTANNMQVLDAKRTSESLVYGKLFMDFNTTIRGPLSGLVVRGDAHLLGGTDVTYVLTDSPLTVQDRMDGLVSFTSFGDTLTRQRRSTEQLALGGIDMLMVLHIDPTVQFRVDLTPDQTNYVEVEGGGDLSFQYTSQGDMVLNGRYTFSEGIVNYSLPVVPLKAFNIHPESYIQWDGEIMNPQINVIATERMRGTVAAESGGSRRTNFDVGISVQDRLDNMQLAFIIDAVDDGNIKSELASMGEDERVRMAIMMMVTGSYMGPSSGGDANMNVGGALGSFLMGEVNNIAGDVLKDVDIDLGLDTYEGAAGQQTDLTFSFAKRFYNDRIRVSIGGKVSTGATTQQTESFLDNFAAEYLLDQAGSKTVKFFYDKNLDSLLDGEVIETGVGIVLRKKVLHIGELFDFRKKKVAVEEEPKEISEEKSNEQEETNNE